MKLEFFRQIFEKYSNIKFYENPPSGGRVVPWGRTDDRKDRHYVTYLRFSQFLQSRLKITPIMWLYRRAVLCSNPRTAIPRWKCSDFISFTVILIFGRKETVVGSF
jgi:hypothetical protein